MMIKTRRNNFTPLIFILGIVASSLPACSKQSWYQGAQSAKEAQCLKGPISEYDDCMQQSSESYDEYNKNRDELVIKPAEK